MLVSAAGGLYVLQRFEGEDDESSGGGGGGTVAKVAAGVQTSNAGSVAPAPPGGSSGGGGSGGSGGGGKRGPLVPRALIVCTRLSRVLAAFGSDVRAYDAANGAPLNGANEVRAQALVCTQAFDAVRMPSRSAPPPLGYPWP